MSGLESVLKSGLECVLSGGLKGVQVNGLKDVLENGVMDVSKCGFEDVEAAITVSVWLLMYSFRLHRTIITTSTRKSVITNPNNSFIIIDNTCTYLGIRILRSHC